MRERINATALMLDIDQAFDKVLDLQKNGKIPGISTGWDKFDQYFQFPPMGQLNLITGFPGSGKSEWVDSLAVNMALREDWKIFVYSPENYPSEYHLQKLCEKLIGKPFWGNWSGHQNINEGDILESKTFVKEHFSFVDCHINNSSVDSILNTIFDECMEKQIDMAIIDPWNKLESVRDRKITTTEFIGQCLTRIQMFSREKGISFWIVAHPSKPPKLKDGSVASCSLYDVSDSANWYNMIDNGFILYRSWADKTGMDYLTEIKIAKIKDRRYGKCGQVNFKFQPWCSRFVDEI